MATPHQLRRGETFLLLKADVVRVDVEPEWRAVTSVGGILGFGIVTTEVGKTKVGVTTAVGDPKVVSVVKVVGVFKGVEVVEVVETVEGEAVTESTEVDVVEGNTVPDNVGTTSTEDVDMGDVGDERGCELGLRLEHEEATTV